MEPSGVVSAVEIPENTQSVWIFGYGSLVWRPAFDYVQTQTGYIKGYKRRFWQGSTDHRGVPGAPGRVVTLVHHEEADYSHPSEQCGSSSISLPCHESVWGVCYEVAPEKVQETLDYLDYREKGGYTRASIDVFANPDDSEPTLRNVLLYTATTENGNYLGPAPNADIAAQIFSSIGPSGPNTEYLFQLYHTLEKHGIKDHHVQELYALVTTLNRTPAD